MKLPDIIFSTPAFISGKSSWTEHIPFAFLLIEKLKPAVFVELGSHFGDSYCAFCQAIQSIGTATRAYAVDTFLGDLNAGMYSRDAYNHLKRINDLHFSHFSNLLCMTFDEASQLFEESSIDLLHIDGLHTYEAVKHDFDIWLPRMSQYGVILFHDTMVREHDFGVWRLMDELKDRYPWFEFRHGYGLGILCTGKSIDPDFINFLNEATSDPHITELFRQTGQKFEAESRARHLQIRLAALTQEPEYNRQYIRVPESEKRQLQEESETTPNREAETIREHLRRSEIEISGLESILLLLIKQKEAMTHSLSWRLTSPLRRIKQVIRNFRNREGHVVPELQHNVFFNEQFYLDNNPDVKAAGLNPLLHYLEFGKKEGRQPKAEPLALPEVNITVTDEKDLIRQSGLFDEEYYLNSNPDLQNIGIDPIGHYCEHGWKEGRYPTATFDRLFYQNEHPDVKTSGMNPLLHYIRYGAARGWKTNIIPELSGGSRPPVTVLFLSVEWRTPGRYYRVINYMDGFRTLGIEANWTIPEILRDQISLLDHVKILIIWRTRINPLINDIIHQAKGKGIVVVFDMDDLLFDPSLAEPEIIDSIRSLHQSKKTMHEYCQGMQATALLADCCTGSTFEIAEEFERLGKPGIIMPNGYSRETFEKSSRLIESINLHPGLIRIGYASGTLTHQHDFAVALPAIAQILGEFPHTVLTVFAEALRMEEFPELSPFHERIEARSLVPFQNMQEELSRFHINIAPLEDNPFCRAKSELKFFEAALLKIPTIASPTPPFQRVITHGYTGFLARNAEDWYQCLRLLVTDKELREQTGQNAYTLVRWRFGPEERGEKITSFLRCLKDKFSLELDRNPLRNLFLPSGESGSGPDVVVNYNFPPLTRRHLLMETRTCRSSKVGILVLADTNTGLLLSTLDSISRQTLAEIEIMIVTDTVDETIPDILAGWQISNRERFTRIAVIEKNPDETLSSLLNTGLAELYTSYFMVTGTGIQFFPETLEKYLAVMEASNAAAGLGSTVSGRSPVVILRSAHAIKYGGFDADSITLGEALETMAEKMHRHAQPIIKMPGSSGFDGYPPFSRKSLGETMKDRAKTILFVARDDTQTGDQRVPPYLINWIREHDDLILVLLLPERNNNLQAECRRFARTVCLADYQEAFPDHFVRRTALLNRIGKVDLICGNIPLCSPLYEELKHFNAPVISPEEDLIISYLTRVMESPVVSGGIPDTFSKDSASDEEKPFRWVFITTNDGSPEGDSEKLWIQSAIRCRESGDEVSIVIKQWVPEPEFLKKLVTLGIGVIFKNEEPYTVVYHLHPDVVVISTGDQDEGVEWFEFCRVSAIPYMIVNHLTKEIKNWPLNSRLIPALRRGYLSAHKVFFTGRNNLRVMEQRLETLIPGAGVFFNPTDFERFPSIPFPADQHGYQIAMVGTLLDLHKGQRLAIELMNQPKWKGRRITLNIYGKGPDEHLFRSLVHDYRLENIRFHDHVQDFDQIWKLNQALLMTSFMEGLPLVLVAAMMCGRVPVVTNVGAHAEVVSDNETGFLAPAPTLRDLDDAMERAWGRRKEWEAIGQKARDFIHQYIPQDPAGHFIGMVRQSVTKSPYK